MGNLYTHCLVLMFGSSTWLLVTAVWMQLPLLVDVLPEQWNLPSYLVVIIQCGNISAVVYGLVHRFVPNINTTALILGMHCFAVLVCISMSVFWSYTVFVWGSERSIPLMVVFWLAAVYCTLTNVVYLPFLCNLRPQLLTTFFVGMGLSALVPSMTALVQGVSSCPTPSNGTSVLIENGNWSISEPSKSGRTTHFGVSMYFAIMAVWLCMATAAFCKLCTIPQTEHMHERVVQDEEQVDLNGDGNAVDTTESDTNEQANNSRQKLSSAAEPESVVVSTAGTVTNTAHVLLLLLTVVVCALQNGVLPSIQIYAVLPYGRWVYHATLICSNLANPLCCMLPFWLPQPRDVFKGVLSVLAVFVCAYIFVLALQSPTPWMLHSTLAALCAVLANSVCSGLLAYIRTVVAADLRASNESAAMFWCGACTQFGSALGAVAMFPLLNVWHVFHMAQMCNS